MAFGQGDPYGTAAFDPYQGQKLTSHRGAEVGDEPQAAQSDLGTVPGQFDPKLVKMAPHGERPED